MFYNGIFLMNPCYVYIHGSMCVCVWGGGERKEGRKEGRDLEECSAIMNSSG